MRISIKTLGCLVAMALTAEVALAHGGNYAGPSGGGTPGYQGPTGGGTLGPTPGQPTPGSGGGTTPGPQPGGTTGPTGGVPIAPVRPGAAAPRGVAGRGGVTPGVKKSKNTNPYQSWDWWWDLNEERFLLLKRKVRSEAASSDNKDVFLGDVVGGIEDVAKVTLSQIRQDVLPALKLSLKDPFYDARAGGVIALGKIGDKSRPELVDDIKSLFADQAKQVRESCCLALGILGNADAIPDLLEIAKNTPKGRKLVGRSGDVLPRTRAFAAIGIGLIGYRNGLDTKVVEELVALAKQPDAQKDVQLGPVIALQLVKTQEAIPELLNIFNDDTQDDYIRAHIGVAFGKVGAKQATGELVKNLDNKSSHVASSCAISLGLLTSKDDKNVVAKLVRFAKGASDRGVKNFCLIALGEIGDPQGLAHLQTSLEKGQTHDRTFAALGLGINGFKNPSAKSEYGEMILKNYKKVKSDAEKSAMAIAMALMGYEACKEQLREDLEKTSSQNLKGNLSTALGLLFDTDAIPAIRNLVRQKGDPDLRKRASIALGLLKDPEAVSTLEAVIQESSASKAILGAATVALGFVGDRRAVPVLVKMVENDKNAYQDVTRAFATVALGFLGDKDDVPILSRIQESSNYLAQTDALAEVLTIL